MSATLGIDVSKDELVMSLYVQGKYRHRTVRNHAEGLPVLLKWLQKEEVGEIHVCMEATGRYWEGVATYLHAQGYCVSVVNPARIHAYIQSTLSRNKTDKQDADRIAAFCATQRPAAWTPPRQEVRTLRSLVRLQEELQSQLTQVRNRRGSGETDPLVLRLLDEQVALLKSQLADVKQALQECVAADATLAQQAALLTSIPGIAQVTAARLLGEQIGSFASARALVAYAGLNPSFYQSGSSVYRRPHISKLGNARVRKYLYFPAMSALRFNPVVQALGQRLQAKQKPKKVTIVAAMRKLLTLAYGVLKSGRPFDPNFAANPARPLRQPVAA